MNPYVRKVFLPLIAVVFLSGALFTAEAQQSSGSATVAEDSLDAEVQDLLAAIDEKRQEIAGLKTEIAAATGEDREVLENRSKEKGLELVDDVRALADKVLEREEEGHDVSADRERVAALLQEAVPAVRSHIDGLDATLVESRKNREAANPEDRPEIEDHIIAVEARLDESLKVYLELEETMGAFGLDVESEKEYLSTTLSERAELLAGRISADQERIASLGSRAEAAPENNELAAELQMEQQGLDRNIGSLDATIHMMDALGLETAQYKQQLFQATGEISTNLLSRDVLTGLASQWANGVVEWVTGNGPRLFFKIVIFLLILLVFRILAKIARRLVKKSIATSTLQVSQLLERTVVSVTGTLVMIFGFLVALSQLGFEVAPLLAGLGVAGFIVGFALQDTLGNFASGVMILLYRPYDVGDLIETTGAFGKVSDMSLVATTILTLDHQTLVVPNSKIWGDVIKNVTAQKVRRVDMIFGISYSDDIPHAERVFKEILEAQEKVLDDPAAIVRLHNLGESSVDFVVRPWVKTDDYWDVYWYVTREVKMRFDAEKISIPFPQRDVHIFENKPTDKKTTGVDDGASDAVRESAPEQPVGHGESEADV